MAIVLGQRPFCALRLLLLLLLFLGAAPAKAETRALLLGVSRYQSARIKDLAGPANDLPAMVALARDLGASDIVSLRNEAVTRSSVEGALHAIGRRARPGDWILLYYTGHGSRVSAKRSGGVDGVYDQFVPLSGFDPDRQDPERFIVDKDFYAWLKRYVAPDVRILMLIDSCYSGSMHRAPDPRHFAYTARRVPSGGTRAIELVDRPGPRFDALLPGIDDRVEGEREDLPNLVYIGASRDDQLAWETELPHEGGPSRGILTYAFEQGLRDAGNDDKSPASDLDGDGVVTVLELSSYLASQARMLSAQRQESSAYFPSSWAELPVFSALPPPRPAIDVPLPAVLAAGSRLTLPPSEGQWRIADAPERADFTWDVVSGAVLRRSGDVVATTVRTQAQLAGVIEKWRSVQQLRPLVSEMNVRLQIDPDGSDHLYVAGAKASFTLELTGRGRAPALYATIFNLASDGTVQLLFPLAGDGEGRLPSVGKLSVIETVVAPPYGVDHLMAIATPDPPTDLRAALHVANGQKAAGRLVGPIRTLLRRGRGQGALSIAELYSDK